MKKIVYFAMIFGILSCANSKKAQKVESGSIIDFTRTYRNYFTDVELMDKKNAAFITKSTLELVGLPANTKAVWFEDDYMVEGNWQHIILPAGTYGKIVFIVSKNTFQIEFDIKDTIKFFFMPQVSNPEFYGLGVKTDPFPKISPGILEKYQFTSKWEYTDYSGGRYYFLSDKNTTTLQVNWKILKPKEIKLRGLGGKKRK